MARINVNLLKSFICIVFVIALAACSSKIDKQKFDTVRIGMSQVQVEKILGKPTEQAAMNFGPLSGTTAIWKDQKNQIVIQFLNDEVKFKNFGPVKHK